MHWLKLEKLDEIKAHRLFVEFRDLPDLKVDLQETVGRLAADRDLYRKADQAPGSLPVAAAGFLQRLEVLNLSPPRPVVLQILRAVPDQISKEVAERSFHILDSYLWRRALTRRTTQNYNRVMRKVLMAVEEDLPNADEQILKVLGESEGPAVVWPSDEQLSEHPNTRAIYGSGRVAISTIRTAIRLVENQLRAPKGETPLSAETELQVEHMMPQSWQANWPLDQEPEETLAEREHQRNSQIDLLGNLTLVTPGMNQSLSNSEWSVKRDELKKHSTLLVSQRYLDQEVWDEESIRERGSDLVKEIIGIWPGADGTFSAPAPH